MLHTTRGIIFQQIKYADSSLIVKVYTEKLGLQSFLVKGVHSKRSKSRSALFQPLNLLNLVIEYKEGKSLHFIREITVEYNYQSIPVNILKSSTLLFLNELLSRSIREETANEALFDWIFNALVWFDLSERENLNFHLIFMIQFSRFLGFYPKQQAGVHTDYFDLQEGRFMERKPEHADYVSGKLTSDIIDLQNATFESANEITISNKERRSIIDTLVFYYRQHLPGFGEMKSLDVLKTILA
jgi:DNA repair protein RecO (recombination protein O)